MSQPTHRIRPKTATKWEHVSEQQLADLRASLGEQHVRQAYTVEKLAEKPAPLATTAEKPADEKPKAEKK